MASTEAMPAGPGEAPSSTAAQAAIRETIDLLELDLGAMIGAVGHAADAVRQSARSSAESFGAIRARTEGLAAKSQDAKRDTQAFAQAAEELAVEPQQVVLGESEAADGRFGF